MLLLVVLLMLACLLAATANRCDMIPRAQGAELYTECQAKMGGARTRSGTMAGGTLAAAAVPMRPRPPLKG